MESAPEWAQCTAVARMSAEDCSHCSNRWENAGDLGLVTFDMPGCRRLRDGEMRRGARGEGDKGWRMEPEKIQGQGEDVLKQVSQTCFFAKGMKIENTRGNTDHRKGPSRWQWGRCRQEVN